MAKGFGSEPLTDSQLDRSEIAAPSQPIRITFAAPSQDLATEPTYSGVELAAELDWSESTLRNRFKTVRMLVTRGVLQIEDLLQDGRYTERAKNLLESLGADLAQDRMSGPRWVDRMAKDLQTLAAMAEAVPVEVVTDSTGYSGAIELYQQHTTVIAASTDEALENTLTLVQELHAQRLHFRRQRQAALVQQAQQDAAEDLAVYEATYAHTSNQLVMASSGNAPAA